VPKSIFRMIAQNMLTSVS